MTKPPTRTTDLDPAPARAVLTASQRERFVTAIEAELAPSTLQMYASVWRQWQPVPGARWFSLAKLECSLLTRAVG
jgi:hypothetical protein